MNINLDNKQISKEEKKIIIQNILIPLINNIQKGNKKIKKKISLLELDKNEEDKLYNEFKINLKELEIVLNKNNLIKII